MKRTTIYLPDNLKTGVERLAKSARCTEAEVIRDAIATKIANQSAPLPRIPLFGQELDDPSIAERVDELLDGFGR